MTFQSTHQKPALSAILLLSGCVSHEYRDLERNETASIHYNFQIGDSVQIITADGESHEFRIKEIRDTGVTSNGVTIEYKDMRIVRLRSVEIGKTTGDTALLSMSIIALLVIGLVFGF